jgi:ribonuclease J
MKLTIHRGTKQIGGNIVEIATDTTRIILDCGKNLPPLDGGSVDDAIEIDGLTRGESQYDAVFITHYHADHCGLIERVNADIPVYAGRETIDVLNIVSDFINSPPPRVDKILRHGEPVRVGDISVLPLNVEHSARGAMLFLIEADGKKLLYTGDFRRIDEAYYPLIGSVDVMLCEGTNIAAANGLTERDIQTEAAKIMGRTRGQVFVLCSTTNIDRIQSIERACHDSGRTIAIDPFARAVIDRVGRLPAIDPVGFVPHFMPEDKNPRAYRYLQTEFQHFSNTETVARMTNLTFLIRQNMGGFMERLNKYVPLEGDVLIYSMWKGYENTRKTRAFLDLCRALGLDVVYLHTSGHAYRETLETAVLRLNPTTLVPIHTENAAAFEGLHENVRALDDGKVLEV